MTDNTREKQHLRTTEDILNDIEEINSIKGIIGKRSLDLFSNLTNNKELFVDDDIVKSITDLHTRLSGTNNLLNESQRKYADLDAEETRILGLLPAGATAPQTNARNSQYGTEISNIRAEKKALKNVTGPLGATGTGSPNFLARRAEYVALSNHVNYFNTANKIHNVDIDLLVGPPRTTTVPADINQDLDALFKKTPTNPNAKYKLCDEKGVPLPESTPGNYTVQINGQTVTLSGIVLTGRSLDFTNLTITPPNADISDVLKLSINGIYESVTTGVNIVCNKKFELKLRRGPAPVPVNTAALRAGVVNTYNGRPPVNRVTDEVNAIYTNRFPTIQREAVFDALKHLDGARFTQLEEYGRKNGKEEEVKEELYQQIYRNFLNTAPIAGTLTAINTYNNFCNRFSADTRDRNNDNTIIGSANLYEQYLHNNLPIRVEDYIKDELVRLIKNDHANNMRLKTELSGFLTDIEERKNDDEEVGGQRIHQATEANIGTNDEMIKRRRKRLLGISRGRPDVNYMRFYNGASHEIKDQKVDISTNTRINDLNNPEPVKYDIKTDISGKNSISVTIKFPDNDKRYPRKEITLKQGEVSTLARKILNCAEIRDFKVRTHIVYNMLVSMIEISKKKNLSLRYRVPGTRNQREIIKTDKNITLYERDDTGGTRAETILFDYDAFVATNTFHGTGDNRSLQTAIDGLMGHFNYAMNEYHEHYRNATKKRLLKTKVSANNFWTSPIKTIMNLRTVRKFDFTTSAKSNNGKENAEIEFKKNTIKIKMGDIELKGKDLGILLEYRKNKVRVFDGIERNIIFSFYDELMKKLRENSKINRSNFAVRDDLTQNIYVMDEDGQLGIVTPEDPGNILGNRNRSIVSKIDLDAVDARGGRRICTQEETKEAFMNPCIMGRMIKVMNKRM